MAAVIPVPNSATTCTNDTSELDATECDHFFFKFLRYYGMQSSAEKSWALVYKKPHIACIVYFVSYVIGVSTFGVLHIAGFPWITSHAHTPILIFLSVSTVQAMGMWSLGPAYGHTLWSKPFQTVGAASGVYIIAASFAGPLSFTPFHNRFVNTIWTCLSCLLMYVSSACGGVAADLPCEPYQSLMTPIANSVFTALKLTDAGSDLGLMRILLEQGPECAWFGREVSCWRYKLLGVTVGVLACAVMVIANSAALVDGQTMLYGGQSRNPRLALLAKTVVLTCELTTLAIAMIKVLSWDSSRTEVAYIALSCVCTVVMFCINMVGTRRVREACESAAQSTMRLFRRMRHRHLSTLQPSEASADEACGADAAAMDAAAAIDNGGGDAGAAPAPAVALDCTMIAGLPVRADRGLATAQRLATGSVVGGGAAPE